MAASILPIRTARTIVRVMTADDLAVVVAYRNDPEVARFQDWDLPATLERATASLAARATDGDLAPGVRTNLAIEVDGTVVGDVYVGIEEPGGVAEIGFTLAVEHQGRGYATEAAGAVLDVLFDQLGVHRVVGQLDPDNVASQRTLERLGLVFESRTTRSYYCRGEWVDNMTYAVTREQFDEWRARPRS